MKSLIKLVFVALGFGLLAACTSSDDYTCVDADLSQYNPGCTTTLGACVNAAGDCKYVVNGVDYNCGSCVSVTTSSSCVIDAAIAAGCLSAKPGSTENELLKGLMNEKLNNVELQLELMNTGN